MYMLFYKIFKLRAENLVNLFKFEECDINFNFIALGSNGLVDSYMLAYSEYR